MNSTKTRPLPASTAVLDALQTRRAIKSFDREHVLPDAILRTLLTAATLAPTAFNIQNRHLVVVTDPAAKSRLRGAAFDQRQVSDASAVFVLSASLTAHRRTDRYLRNAPSDVRRTLEPMIADHFEGHDALLREEGARSIGMAAMALMLAATELGLDSCPMTGFDAGAVSRLLGLDVDHPPLMLVAVGRGTGVAHPRLGFLDFEEFVSVDHFDDRRVTGPVEVE